MQYSIKKERNLILKKYNVKFKKIYENEIILTAKNKNDALKKAKELFATDLKDTQINNISKYYYIIRINNKDMIVKVNDEEV